jgi:hypothetical protein
MEPIGSIFFGLAEREGFEPSIRFCRIHDFQSCSFDRSDTSPENCVGTVAMQTCEPCERRLRPPTDGEG